MKKAVILAFMTLLCSVYYNFPAEAANRLGNLRVKQDDGKVKTPKSSEETALRRACRAYDGTAKKECIEKKRKLMPN
jgi:hypothetical protein